MHCDAARRRRRGIAAQGKEGDLKKVAFFRVGSILCRTSEGRHVYSGFLRMTEIHELILDIEKDLKCLLKKAMSIDTPRYGIKPQKAIISLQKTIRGVLGWELGELKNAFGLNDFGIKKNEKLINSQPVP